jgi:MYND finger
MTSGDDDAKLVYHHFSKSNIPQKRERRDIEVNMLGELFCVPGFEMGKEWWQYYYSGTGNWQPRPLPSLPLPGLAFNLPILSSTYLFHPIVGMGDSKSFMRMNEALVAAANSGRWRECSDIYLQLFRLPRLHDERLRYWLVSGYTSIFREEQLTPTEKDLEIIKSMYKDEKNVTEIRAQAAFTLGLLYWLQFRQEDSLKAYNKVLKLTMSDTERRRIILNSMMHEVTAGSTFDQIVSDARNSASGRGMPRSRMGPAAVGINPNPAARVRKVSHGSDTWSRITPEMSKHWLDLSQRVVGAECDFCHKKPDTGKTFQRCGICSRKAYCGPDCQKKDWKGPEGSSHKRSCRPASEFRSGDIVMIKGLTGRTEMNGSIVEVLGLAEGQTDSAGSGSGSGSCRYNTRIIGGGNLSIEQGNLNGATPNLGIKSENLSLVVPVEEREVLS